MKKMLVRGLLATTLFACGGGMDIASVVNEEEATSGPMPEEALVAEVQWRGEQIQFINTAESGAAPDILMLRSGAESEGDILYQFQQQARYDVTAAELWLAVAGNENIPEALVLNHQSVVEELGRPLDYQNFDPNLVQKAAFAIRDMFPLTKANTCWSNVKVRQGLVGVNFPIYFCSTDHANTLADSTFLRNANIASSSACPSNLNTKEGIRAGVYNNNATVTGSNSQTAQLCFDGGSSGWVCQNIVGLPAQSYYMGEYAKSGTSHRFAVGAFSTAAGFITGGAAKLSSGVQQFQTTTCTGEPQ